MKPYNPLTAPDPTEWLATDEGERIEMVRPLHQRARIRLPRLDVHATFHVIVENQIALGSETPVEAVAKRLMEEGLDRHQAIHAIASVVAYMMHDMAQASDSPATTDVEGRYYADLEQLTAEGWRNSG